MTRIMYSLLHLQCHVFNLKSQSMSTVFSWSLLQRAAEKRPEEPSSIEIRGCTDNARQEQPIVFRVSFLQF